LAKTPKKPGSGKIFINHLKDLLGRNPAGEIFPAW
jgi:hypothetical protein